MRLVSLFLSVVERRGEEIACGVITMLKSYDILYHLISNREVQTNG